MNRREDKKILAKELHDRIQGLNRRRSALREYHAYNHYRKNKRFIKYYVPKFDKMMKEERKKLREFKLRKQYSKNYQVVELEITGDIDDYDVAAEWLDNKMDLEMQSIPDDLLKKDNQGSGGYKKPFKQKSTPQKYSQQRKGRDTKPQQKTDSGTPKPFGTEKQWWHILKEDNQDFLIENECTVEDINSYEELQAALKLIRDNGLW